MSKRPKVTRLLAPTVPLVLEVEGNAPKLELDLAWTMRGVIRLESALRSYGKQINVLQHPGQIWDEMDSTTLAVAVWSMSQQEHPEYADDEGFEIIASYITTTNQAEAIKALKSALLESLPEDKKNEIQEAERKAEELIAAGEKPAVPDPTIAPAQ